jgi:hypothetical protein
MQGVKLLLTSTNTHNIPALFKEMPSGLKTYAASGAGDNSDFHASLPSY